MAAVCLKASLTMLLRSSQEGDALVVDKGADVVGETCHYQGNATLLAHEELIDSGERNHLVERGNNFIDCD